jgi:hypothetical protein
LSKDTTPSPLSSSHHLRHDKCDFLWMESYLFVDIYQRWSSVSHIFRIWEHNAWACHNPVTDQDSFLIHKTNICKTIAYIVKNKTYPRLMVFLLLFWIYCIFIFLSLVFDVDTNALYPVLPTGRNFGPKRQSGPLKISAAGTICGRIFGRVKMAEKWPKCVIDIKK